jgi:hypothetical protein
MTFLEELQALEEPTKTKVLVVSTAILMIIVIYFWIAYFNGIVSSGAQATISDQDQSAAMAPALPEASQGTASPEPGFWGRVGNGTAVVGDAIGGGIQWIGRAFESPREYKIK